MSQNRGADAEAVSSERVKLNFEHANKEEDTHDIHRELGLGLMIRLGLKRNQNIESLTPTPLREIDEKIELKRNTLKNDIDIIKSHKERLISKREWKKEGILEKQCGSLLTSWQERLCKLTTHKLRYSNPKKAGILTGVIDFDCLSCRMEVDIEALKFRIQVLFGPRYFCFRAKSKEDLIDWVQCIQKQISLSKGAHVPQVKVCLQPKFWKHDRISQDELMRTCRTGDVILFRSFSLKSKVLRLCTCSNIDHVGIAMRFSSGKLQILESLGKHGVQFFNWESFAKYKWNTDYEEMMVRKLHCKRPPEMIDELETFVLQILNKPYSLNIGKFCTCSSKKENPHAVNGYFCSELVASIFKIMKVIPENLPSSHFLPGSFETSHESLSFINGAHLGNEILIDFFL